MTDEKPKGNEKELSRRFYIILCSLVAMITVVCSVVIICSFVKKPDAVFTPPPFESDAVVGTPQVPENLGYSPIVAQGAFNANICGNVICNDGAATVYFTSAQSNTVWLKLRIYDNNGELLGESGLLKPGEYVKNIKINAYISTEAKIKLKIMAYQPESYYSAGAVTLNTSIKKGE